MAEETSDKAGDLYTVQVLSTSQASKAKAIVAQLKNKGFDAYTEEIKLDNSQLFRVRVAKLSKEKIQAVREKLTKVVDGLGRLQVVKVSK
ncbi:MAG: hypothetical protein A2527_02265 [Candidatus Lambdaproteobacteria bacterium RIFOXYD2_FULL_50_16]|uniref:SPOR domain-containing protein n=1 Tax=Candidatus Lambdaproteobacteria bacterium RIFOXYD2_FULL_50_16 TaxID=1817772 RepID=A0A1F6GDU8_9PROT|nr:MAG: hypothetical protein A2527_02265 [Candidatus Lambdaproteobacteria bacterium RIFOXYD2_FULL_50_16]